MGELVHLVRPAVSHDTVALLRMLLQEAEAGRLSGLAAVWFIPGGYEHGVAGRAVQAPTFTRGAIRALDDLLASLV